MTVREIWAYLPVRMPVHQGRKGNAAISEKLTVYTLPAAEEAGQHNIEESQNLAARSFCCLPAIDCRKQQTSTIVSTSGWLP